MDADEARTFLLTLPHVVETEQWGNNLVFWVGDKAIGGKMFALLDLNKGVHGKISYATGAEHFAELVEIEGLYPAPYFARIYWIAAERWNVFRTAEWQEELRAAHAITFAKLPPKVHKALALPPKELKRLVSERTAFLAAKKQKKS
jgi:predicted DNA-binding protein (MmcQ/YjbR family)